MLSRSSAGGRLLDASMQHCPLLYLTWSACRQPCELVRLGGCCNSSQSQSSGRYTRLAPCQEPAPHNDQVSLGRLREGRRFMGEARSTDAELVHLPDLTSYHLTLQVRRSPQTLRNLHLPAQVPQWRPMPSCKQWLCIRSAPACATQQQPWCQG